MQTKNILIVGGAGYIGSHMMNYLNSSDYSAIALDNLSTGHKDALAVNQLIIGDIADSQLLDKLFTQYHFDAVMHFASFIEVNQSVKNPAMYYQNNVANTINLLNSMIKHNVKKFIFSSTAAVYGEPQYTPINEAHPLKPINPYGHSKQMVEQIIEDFSHAYDFQFAILRYFNAAGADPSGKLAERHQNETHLIPLILQVAKNQRENITVFGKDYDTPDGTCVRDYVHVNDLCAAHWLALQSLQNGKKRAVYNLGNNTGYSVQQVIDLAREVTQHPIPVVEGQRRAGDPAILVADASLAMQELGWRPKYPELKTIIEHAWCVERK